MCTIRRSIPKSDTLIGWKVVGHRVKTNEVISPFQCFQWTPNAINHAEVSHYNPGDCLFHCFSKRKDARKLKRHVKRYPALWPKKTADCSLKIIKVILSGEIYNGETMGIDPFNILPATCGKIAFWDGKFHS